jgi:hypothetical protein
LQFFVLSYEGPHWLAEQTNFRLPMLGETGLFAQGGTIQLPDSGDTDRGYWVVPGILQTVEAGRQAAGAEGAEVGVLVNNEYVNPDLFGVLALQSYPAVQVQNLARTGSSASIHPRFFEYDYLVLIEDNYKWIDAAAQEALRHLEEAPELFDAVFEPAGRFPLPDGDAVLLYRKARWPVQGYNVDDYHAVAKDITALSEAGDAILLVPPEQAEALGATYNGRLAVYLLPGTQPLNQETTAQELDQITNRHPVLFVVFQGEETADPERFVEGWLNEHAYRAQTRWQGGVRVVVYGAPHSVTETERSLDAKLGDQIRLLSYGLADAMVEPGRIVRLTLSWQAKGPLEERLTVFAHLLDGEGRLVAQQDSEPGGGSRPTTTWLAGEVIRDQLGILLPPDLAGGEYRLVVGLYRPDSGERLPVFDPLGNVVGDSIPLATIQIE